MTQKVKHVTAVNGAITAYVRKRWGIQKMRENGDLHHAVDAGEDHHGDVWQSKAHQARVGEVVGKLYGHGKLLFWSQTERDATRPQHFKIITHGEKCQREMV